MKLSIVIPAYNEEKDIKGAILDVIKIFPEAEIIIVNDASTDKTFDIVYSTFIENHIKDFQILTNHKNMGHGFSVVRGLRMAKGDYILYIDADRQIKFNNGLFGGYDIVSGWRIKRSDKLFRKVISFCLKMTNLIRYGYYIRDANCPFKIYKRKTIQPLLDKLPISYIVPIACLEVLARKEGLIIATIPMIHSPYEGERKGFLQVLNLNTVKFFSSAFFEIISL